MKFLSYQLSVISFLYKAVLWTMFYGLWTTTAQTISAPVIQCVSTDQATGDININWTPYTPDACGPFVEYRVLGSTDINGPYTLVGSVVNAAASSFTHVGANGTILQWYYKIIAVHNCPGFLADTSALKQDEVLDIPPINYVTVLDNGTVEVNWQPNSSSQTAGYFVYYFLGGGLSNLIDSVLGVNSATYIDAAGNASAGSLVYSVASYDFCRNRSLINPNPHNTIFLTQNVADCSGTIELRWNLYQNWPIGVQYQIEMAVDSGAPTILTTLPDNSTGYNVSPSQLSGSNVCFRIIALHPNGTFTSQSNRLCLPINFVRSTAFNYLRTLTVNENNGVDLSWYIDSTADLNKFYIENSLDGTSYLRKDSIDITPPVAFLNDYYDATAQTDVQSYYYQIISKDDCNFESTSNKGKTVFLEADVFFNNSAELSWNEFALQYATITNYTVNRVANNQLTPITTLSPLENSFTENIATVATADGQFCYVIEAEYNLALPGLPAETHKSKSNIACVEREPLIFMPNALVPSGKNKFVKPVLQVPNVREYVFIIYDRWGKKMFETNSTTAGWDGTNKGETLPFGTYTYYVKAVSQQGKEIIKKGTVTLVR